MNGMLQHHQMYREGIERHQQEAREWAQAQSLGRVANSARATFERRRRPARLTFLAAPMAAAVTMLAILI